MLNKDTVAEHKENAKVVFDDTLKGKKIDAIEDPKISMDFEDQGMVSIPSSSQNMMCPGQKIPSKKFKKRYDEMAWECAKCGKMHRKSEEC